MACTRWQKHCDPVNAASIMFWLQLNATTPGSPGLPPTAGMRVYACVRNLAST